MTVENPSSRTLERLGFDPDQAGVLVTEVAFGSEAASAGIQADNMLIVAVNDEETPDVANWEAAIDGLSAGVPVKLDVVAMGPAGPQALYFFLRAPGSGD